LGQRFRGFSALADGIGNGIEPSTWKAKTGAREFIFFLAKSKWDLLGSTPQK
jgi:hypothetical protein